MRRLPIVTVSVAMVLVLASACTAAAGPGRGVADPPTPSPGGGSRSVIPLPVGSLPTPEPTVPLTPAGEPLFELLPGDAFSDPTTIDNQWLPLRPGTRWVWEGSSLDEGDRLEHRVVTTVTDLVKVIDGVLTRVILEQDFTDGELVEAELAFFAQDDARNVWHLGQYPEEYEDGEFVAAPAWLAGYQGARAGIAMKAEPEFGPSYAQGWGPEVNWNDRARVFDIRSETCVPAGCYEDVLVISEFTLDEVDSYQLKYYAPGVGNVRVGWAGSQEEEQEVLELKRVMHLSPAQLREAGLAALELEARAYAISTDVYANTQPARFSSG
jgi:hypothetical protein